MDQERRERRFRQRIGTAALLGLVIGAVLCLQVEASSPAAWLPFAWQRPVHVPRSLSAAAGAEVEADGTEEGDPTDAELLAAFRPRPDRAVREDDRMVQILDDGTRIGFTFDPEAQERTIEMLTRHEVPFGAVVALDPRTGAIKVYAEVANENPQLRGLVRKAIAPAASVFKIVTAAALLESGGVAPDEKVCHPGAHDVVTAAHLVDHPRRDKVCETLGEALAHSTNTVFAKLADRNLDQGSLFRAASAFGFGREIPFLYPVEVSPARIPFDRLERARTAAGFLHTRLTPLHGALIAASVANGGQMMLPRLVEYVQDAEGRSLVDLPPPAAWTRTVRAETARTLTAMMEGTVEDGTAAKAFADEKRPANLRGLRIAGKTGSLSSKGEEQFHFSWFVGYAPAERPTIAVAVLMVNRPAWRLKAHTAARHVLSWLM